jgi:branched-chain amino acid transport system substrate-binding protein
MKLTRRSLATIIAIAFFAVMTSCKKQDAETDTSKNTLNLNSPSNTEILIGAVFPMTGPISTYGQESINGIKLALETINKTPIKGKIIKLIIEDNKSEPFDSISATRKLIDIDRVHALLGSVASSNTLAQAPIAQEAKVPLLTPASTNEKVTMTGNYISRSCFTDAYQGAVMAKFAKETLGSKKAVIITDVSSGYSKGLAAIFKSKFEELGGKVIGDENKINYSQEDKDFRSLLKKVKRLKPEVVFLPGYYNEVGVILKQARKMGIKVPFLGGDAWDSPKLRELAGPEGIKNNYISTHFSADDTDPKVQNFVRLYESRFNKKPGSIAALGYDGILMMADALKRANSLTRDDIQNAIIATNGFYGVTGNISLDQNRNARKSAVILETTANGNVFKQRVSP